MRHSNGDETAIRRGGACVQQKVKRNLADRRPVNCERFGNAVIPLDTKMPCHALMLHKEAQIVEIGCRQDTRLGSALISYEGCTHDVANAGESALQEVQRRLQHGRLVAICLDRINGIEHAGERVIDLMRHARCKAPEHRTLFLLGKMSREDLAIAESLRHRIEPIKQLTELAGDPPTVTGWNRLHPALADLLDIACQNTQRLQHAL